MSDNNQACPNLFFLGPKGEQRKFFQEMIELINNDMIFWRRNFHPKDPPVIPYREITSTQGQAYQDHFIQSLVQLLAELKMDIPFFSPRYMAHMTGDVSLPGLLGYYAGLVYNANNVSSEASPVTLKYELEVGKQFAKLFNYDLEQSFGHITSGGTVANIESVFYNKASRFLPLSMGLALKIHRRSWPAFLKEDAWGLANYELSHLPQLLKQFSQYWGEGADLILDQNSPAKLGDGLFFKLVDQHFSDKLGTPVLIVPATAHYSWSKASHLFGIGRDHCLTVPIDRDLCMSSRALEQTLLSCLSLKRPVIQTVCVLGSTEYGSFDPLDEITASLRRFRKLGLYSPLHLDAAYGGYFKTMFVDGEHSQNESCEFKQKNEKLYSILNAVGESDSITVDPHKLGHTPYGAGVFITKHGFSKEFVAEKADYCLSQRAHDETDVPLGRYILEGSKPGASATSVYFSNQMIPLNCDGYGSLFKEMIDITNNFYQRLLLLNSQSSEFSDAIEVCPLAKPQSNLLCFYLKPKSMSRLSQINQFNLELLEDFFPRPTEHIQKFEYLVSKTKLQLNKVLEEDRSFFTEKLELDGPDLQVMRIVMLNRWSLMNNAKGIDYLNDFLNSIKMKSLEILSRYESSKKISL